MIRHSFFLALAAFVLLAVPARADIDHHCLNQCIATGMRSDKCLTQCSYKEMPQSPNISALNPHRVLESPISEEAGIMIADDVALKPPMPPPPEKNYACFVPCVNSRVAYALCEQRCAKR